MSAERLGTRRSGVGGGADPAVVAAALIRSLIGLDGLDGLIRHTETVRQAGGPEVNPLWMSATGIQGSALWMLGDLDAAEARLLEARHHIGAEPMFEAGLLAHLAAIRLLRDDLDGARALSKASLELAETYRLDGVLIDVEVFGVGALVAARSRDQTTARRCWLATERLLARLHELSPRTALFCNLLLAETALALGDAAAAAEFADAAASAQRREPSATTLNDWLDDLRQRLQSWPAGPPAGVPRFTPAELRLLEYLPTHLTLQEIADRLNVSRHTTKSHSIAVYRKLGVASRSDAVTEARRIGLLHA